MTSLHTVPLDDHLVIARESDRRLFVLNATGRRMWELFERGWDVDAVVVEIAVDYGVAPEVVRDDVAAVLDGWRANGLRDRPGAVPGAPAQGYSAAGAAIPRGDWPHQRVYCLWGTQFAIRTTDPAISDLLFPLMAHLEAGMGETPQTALSIWKHEGGYAIARGRDVVSVEDAASGALTGVLQAVVRYGAPQLDPAAVLHASAVSHDRGAVVMAASARSGKSTLTAALARAGFGYLSDDSVPLDGSLHAVAMPLAICLKSGSWPVLASRYPELEGKPVYQRFGQAVRYLYPGSTDSVPSAQGVPVNCLVFPRYEQGHSLSVQALAPAESLQRLLDAEAWVSFESDKLERWVSWVARTPAYALEYGALDDAVRAVERIVT